MKNARYFLLLTGISLLCVARLSAQTQVQGRALDAEGEPLAFANVLLFTVSDSAFIKGGMADEVGAFRFVDLEPGAYFCHIRMVGYPAGQPTPFQLDDRPGEMALGDIVLSGSAEMDEVMVVAKRPFLQQRIDRMVVNVSNSITHAGGTALQVLQRSPGVQVNALTKSISMAGKQGVVLMINGKISRLPMEAVVDMLSGMNADNIDRIELIHTPPANYEAEGNAGIIHIVLKQSSDVGLNGGYTAKIGYGRGPKAGASGYFNQRSGSINLFGSYDLDYNLNPQVFTNYRRVVVGGDTLETASASDRPHTPTTTQNARLGADFQVSKKTTIGVLGTFFDRNWYMEAENAVTYSRNGKVESLLRMPNTETNHARSFTGNLNLSHQFSESQSLSLDADYIYYTISNPSTYQLLNQDASGNATSESELNIAKETPIQVGVAKADYVNNLGENTKLEMGAKLTSMRFMNEVMVQERAGQADWKNIASLTSVSQMKETVAGAYFSFSTKLDDKTDLKAGLRYEHTDTRLDSGEAVVIVDRNYGSWFPTVFLSRKISETQAFNLSYSRRISRPKISQLAPFLIFSDPTTLVSGNPALQPAFTDAFSLSYTLKTWRLGISYSVEKAPQGFIPKVDTRTNQQIITFGNLGQQKTWSANLYVPLKLAEWWEISNNVYFNSVTLGFELEGTPLKVKNLAYGFNSIHTFTLPKQFTLEVSGNYDSPNYWGIAYWQATGSLNIGVEKNFGDKWGKVRLNVSDIFLSTNWFGMTEQPEVGLLTKQSFQFAERVFMLSWTNTFGNNKLKATRQRQTGASEELRRI